MDADYKKDFYARYVSAHNAELYGRTDIAQVRARFTSWNGQYGDLLPAAREAKMLDAGCGEGGFVLWLQERGFEAAEGVDVSSEQIALGKELGIKGLTLGDLRDFLGSRKEAFDVIFLRDVLGHFPKREVLEVLQSVHGALKHGGMLVIKTPNAESPMTGRLRYGDFTHDTSFTGQSLRQLFLVFGFTDVRIRSMRPAVHGIVSGVRFLLWLVIELQIRIYRLVEAGSAGGWFTQNVMATGKK